jgi:hypothetical protein
MLDTLTHIDIHPQSHKFDIADTVHTYIQQTISSIEEFSRFHVFPINQL